MKRSLGRRFATATWTLQSLDRFLRDHAGTHKDPTRAAFHGWCQTQEHLASGVRRVRMLEVHNFSAYRRRTEPDCFLPDLAALPPYHQRAKPYIFSTTEVAKLLKAAEGLAPSHSTPLRPEVTRLAIVLLFITGIRRAELLNLTVGDYNRKEATLHIRETKFYKSRLLRGNRRPPEEEMTPAASILDPASNPALYVSSVLTLYVDLPDTPLHASTPDQRQARNWFDRGISLPLVETALLLASLRRMIRPPHVPPLRRIRSLAYFQPLIEELLENPVPDGYLQYLRIKFRSLVDKTVPTDVQKTTFSDDR